MAKQKQFQPSSMQHELVHHCIRLVRASADREDIYHMVRILQKLIDMWLDEYLTMEGE